MMGEPQGEIAESDALDEALAVLSHPTRRRVLQLIRGRGSQEIEIDPAEFVSGADVRTIEIQLDHKHLPMLEEAGFIEWDRDGDTIGPGSAFGEVEPLLGMIADNRDALPG